MGVCGCGEFYPDKILKIDNNKFIVISKYYGCRDCYTPIGLSILFFDKKGIKSWMLQQEKMEDIKFDEYGSNNGHGESWGFLGEEELMDALEEIKKEIGGEFKDYDIEGFIKDFGLKLLQKGMRSFEKKYDEKNNKR